MVSVLFVNGHWFAYLPDRVLGPFNFEKQARKAAKRELNDN